MRRTNESTISQFEKDCCNALEKLQQAIESSRVISKTIEEKLNEEDLEDLMVVLRERMPATIRNLSEVYRIIKKYESKCHAVETAKDDFRQEESK